MTQLTPHRIWLIGSMGSGKTTVGGALAALLGWPLLDNDRELLAHEGRPLMELADDGPEALHDRESAQLARAAARPPPFVAGVAAGVADRREDLALLRATGWVVYLRATVMTLAARVGSGDDRPWLEDDPAAWLASVLARREPAYLAVADVVVDVDTRTPDEVAAAVVQRLAASVDPRRPVADAVDGGEPG